MLVNAKCQLDLVENQLRDIETHPRISEGAHTGSLCLQGQW